MVFIALTSVAFFVPQWNEYYTHVLTTNIGGVFGVTEAQVSALLLFIRVRMQ